MVETRNAKEVKANYRGMATFVIDDPYNRAPRQVGEQEFSDRALRSPVNENKALGGDYTPQQKRAQEYLDSVGSTLELEDDGLSR